MQILGAFQAPRFWSLNTIPDETEPGLLGEMVDTSFGARKCYRLSLGCVISESKGRESKTPGASQKDSLKGSSLAKMGEFEHLLKKCN